MIARLYAQGLSQEEIAKKLGVHQSTICRKLRALRVKARPAVRRSHPSLIAAVLAQAQPGRPNDCWIWPGARHGFGYGVITWKQKNYTVHRISYEHYNGPLVGGLHALHKCDNPPCWNPRHLYAGTHQDNMRDMLDRKRNPYIRRRGELK